jgi:phosphohistidine swiveling domain-containing protein
MNYEVKPLKKEYIHIQDWEFAAQQRGEQPILLCDFFSRALNKYFFYYITGEEKPYSYLFTDSYKLNHLTQEGNAHLDVFKEKMKDTKFLKESIRNTVDIPRAFNEKADKEMAALKNDANVSNERLAQYWENLDAEFLKVIPWFWYPWFLATEDILTNKVKDGLEKYRNEIENITDFEEALLSVVFPLKKTSFQLEQKDMYELVSFVGDRTDFESDPLYREKAEEYLKKYDWLTTFILTPIRPMSYPQLVERVQRARNENYIETFEKQQSDNAKKEIITKEVIEIVKNDIVLIDNIEDARELGYALTAGIEEAYMSTSKYITLLSLVAERMGVSFEETKYFLSKEIYQILMDTFKISKEELENRKKGFAMLLFHGEQYIAYGEEGHTISAWVDKELNTVDESIKEFNGQVACKGQVTGKVRIALTPDQAHELQEGEILVCPMTNPDYVPAMKRSAAIITDEGGLLSHAAIMSREFNKPCIIATKIATKLLKNGDTVEVDAQSGRIKIIST